MIPMQLTPEQAQVVRSGADKIDVTLEQAASIRGKLISSGRKLSCTCETCRTCQLRAAKRRERQRKSQVILIPL
jgi:hypothetical protein